MDATPPTPRHIKATLATWCAAIAAAGFATACGGGGGGGDPAPAPTPTPTPTPTPAPSPPPITTQQRAQATKTTAESTGNACTAVQPFYWEVGDATAALASGSTDAASGNPTYTANTLMSIASASKWLYAAYVAEKRAGVLTARDISALHFTSGYTSFDAFGSCGFNDTIDGCLNNGNNGAYTPANDGRFFYDGGHMQKHASLEGLGAQNSVALATELRSRLGTDVNLSFSQPQPAGGVVTTPADYARFLRKVLGGQLRMGALLGANAVCTNPRTCATAGGTPAPLTEDWQYSMGHWVDADATVGDGAFSSTGAFGFHPWIDASKSFYGVLARRTTLPGTGFDSVTCARLMRKAWATGVAQ